MILVQSLPSQPCPKLSQPILDGRRRKCCKTHMTHCEHFQNIHKRTQVKQTQTSLVFIQTRNCEIRTVPQWQKMSRFASSLQRKIAPLLHRCPCASRPLPAQLRAFTCASHNACRTAHPVLRFVTHYLGRGKLLHLPWHLSSTTAPLLSCCRPTSLRLIALCSSTYLWYLASHACPSTPFQMA